ncbi:hypothetical protein ACU4GH_31955 [Bradyrhizobium betae]
MTSESVSESPVDLHDGWRVGNPARYGFDPALLQDMRRRVANGRLDNVHAIIVARDGVLVYEQYAAGQDQNGLEPAKHTVFNAATKHNGNSMTKSVIALLVGVALQRGWIKTLDAPVPGLLSGICRSAHAGEGRDHALPSADNVGRP